MANVLAMEGEEETVWLEVVVDAFPSEEAEVEGFSSLQLKSNAEALTRRSNDFLDFINWV